MAHRLSVCPDNDHDNSNNTMCLRSSDQRARARAGAVLKSARVLTHHWRTRLCPPHPLPESERARARPHSFSCVVLCCVVLGAASFCCWDGIIDYFEGHPSSSSSSSSRPLLLLPCARTCVEGLLLQGAIALPALTPPSTYAAALSGPF